MDDLLITGNNDDDIVSIKRELKKVFDMKDLRLLHYYLGIEVDEKPKHIFISQKKYVGQLLNKFGMQDCNRVSTPMEQNLKLTSNEGSTFEDPTKYKNLVGSLIYLTTTCTNIIFLYECFLGLCIIPVKVIRMKQSELLYQNPVTIM